MMSACGVFALHEGGGCTTIKEKEAGAMKTLWSDTVDRDRVLQEYPRPQMRRESCCILNGLWDYAITDSDQPPEKWEGSILVPFSPEAPLSGVNRALQPGQYLWYRRALCLKSEQGRLLLHFGAVDQIATVYLNGKPLGGHTGGYTAFTVDLTGEVTGDDILLVRVRDDTDRSTLARGKQKTKRGGIWYTPQSGIWQTVWAEEVPKSYIKNLRIQPQFDEGAVEITVESEDDAPCAVEFDGAVYEGRSNAKITVPVPMFRPWSPETPYLYEFSASLGADRVQSYFAMRKVEVRPDENGVPRIHLNGRPYFMHGVLDQGYWPDGLYTAPCDEALILDIQSMKAMGFNTLRKHMKTEPMRWYYHCDRLGMLVWQDMPCGGAEEYKLPVVCLPLVTKRHRKDSDYAAFGRQDEQGRRRYYAELTQLVEQLRNVPSVVLWCPFNEGWGQFDAEKAVALIRTLDPERLIDHASGWHDQGIGQLQSLHVYFTKYRHRPDRRGRATILSEYGGYHLKVRGHCWNSRSFGYRAIRNPETLLKAYEELMLGQILPALEQGLSAAIYTQLSDVEDELNGLWTYDRTVQKLPSAAVRNVNLQLTGWNQRR